MLARQRAPVRAPAALLFLLGTLLMVVLARADTDVTWRFRTLDGVSLSIPDVAAQHFSSVLLQRCRAQGDGLTVSASSMSDAAGSDPITIRILDTTVADATLTFHGYTPGNSLVHVVNMTATMKGSTPLFNLQNFYVSVGDGSSMFMQRVQATWSSAPGGSVVLLGGSESLKTASGKVFSLSEAVVTGAAHVLELVAGNSCTHCTDTNGGLNAFDLVEFHEPRGAFVYSGVVGYGFACSAGGMVRFSNITIVGDQAFFEAENAKDAVVYNWDKGNIVFSGITTGGSLFDFKDDGILVSASGASLKYTFCHINVKAVMSSSTYTTMVPTNLSSSALSTWDFHMGNVTVDGTLRETIDELNAVQLFPTQVMDAYGNVQEVAGSPYPTVDLNTPTAAYCVTDHYGSVTFVDLVPGVNRAECDCAAGYYTPYCTGAVDPLVYYDAYSPSPAVCDVDNCNACLFGQTSQCGACAAGYMLTNELGCEIIPCDVANCSRCTTDNVCDVCAAGYLLTATSTCAKCTVSHCNQCVSPGDGTACAACAAGYKLNDKDLCKKTGTPWWAWLIVGIAAAAVVAGVIVLVVCCVRRRKAEANEYDATTAAGDVGHTAWGVPIAMDAARPAQAAPASPQKNHTDDCPKVRHAWVSPAVIDDPPTQSSHSASRHGHSADCHAVRAAQEAETIVANPLDDDDYYPVRLISGGTTADAGSRAEHPIPPTSTRH